MHFPFFQFDRSTPVFNPVIFQDMIVVEFCCHIRQEQKIWNNVFGLTGWTHVDFEGLCLIPFPVIQTSPRCRLSWTPSRDRRQKAEGRAWLWELKGIWKLGTPSFILKWVYHWTPPRVYLNMDRWSHGRVCHFYSHCNHTSISHYWGCQNSWQPTDVYS